MAVRRTRLCFPAGQRTDPRYCSPDAQTQHSNAQHQRRDLYPDMAPPESGPKPRLSIGTCSRLTGWHSHGTVMERRPGFSR